MAQGILPFIFEAAPQPMDLTAHAGLTLVAETMLALGLDGVVEEALRLRIRDRGFPEYAKLQALVLLLAAGGECVEDVRVLGADAGLVRLLGGEVPSPDALHDFLAACHDEAAWAQRPTDGAWIPAEPPALEALQAVNQHLVHRAVAARAPRRATLDLDATLIESHKREARPHYLGGRGYQPLAVLWAEEDLVVADQYRDGNVPAGTRTLEVARRGFDALPASVTDRFFRGDSACYDEALLKYLVRTQVRFTISADMTRELRQVCAGPQVEWAVLEERLEETVDWGEVVFVPGDWPQGAPALRYVALRRRGRQGRLFADGTETKYLAVVSNRWEVPAPALVRWHWAKAGTIERVHDVTKNDLGAGCPPSGKFGANAAWYRVNLLTYNVLTVLKRQALPTRLIDARPKRLRYEVFTVPAEIHTHARQLRARLGAPPLTVAELIEARQRLRDLRAASSLLQAAPP
jgi:hypothetical protein